MTLDSLQWLKRISFFAFALSSVAVAPSTSLMGQEIENPGQSKRVTALKPAVPIDTDSNESDPQHQPPLPTPQQVVDKHILACGGHEVLSSISSVQLYWEGEFGHVETYCEPGFLSINFFRDGDCYLKRRVSNGIVWTASGGWPTIVTGKSRTSYLRRVKFVPPDNWFTESRDAEVVGMVKIDGQDHYQMNYTSQDGIETEKFYSVDTGLLTRTKKMEYTLSTTGEITTRDSLDYQWFGDMQYPVISKITSGNDVTIYKLTDMVTNQRLPEEAFEMTDQEQSFLTEQRRSKTQ